MKLAGKTALVTGASRGIGRAITEAFVARGIQVFGTSRNPAVVEWPVGVTPLRLDLASSQSVELAWGEGRLGDIGFDLLVNNAGTGTFGAFEETEFESWDQQVQTMLLAPMKLAHLAAQQWSEQRPGVLVNVGSLAVEYPIPYMNGYNTAKAGLAAFCESLQLERDPSSVRILELRLGDVNTAFNEYIEENVRGKRQERVWTAMSRHVAKGPKPELVAERLVKYLESERSGVVRVGGFFQTVIASLFGKLVSHRVRRAVNLSYYNVGSER